MRIKAGQTNNKIEEIKREFDEKFGYLWMSLHPERDIDIVIGEDGERLWEFVEQQLTKQQEQEIRMKLEVEIGLEKFGQLMKEKQEIRKDAVKGAEILLREIISEGYTVEGIPHVFKLRLETYLQSLDKGDGEQYKCQSYFDDDNKLQDCTCGKCK